MLVFTYVKHLSNNVYVLQLEITLLNNVYAMFVYMIKYWHLYKLLPSVYFNSKSVVANIKFQCTGKNEKIKLL